MKDVVKEKNQIRIVNTPMKILSQMASLIMSEPFVLLGITGEVCGRVVAIMCSTYTTFAVSDGFNLQNRSEDEAKDYLSTIFFIANILAFVFSLVFGYSVKYYKVTNLILVTNGIMLIGSIFLVYDLDKIGWMFTISYCFVASMNTSNFVLS